MSIDPDPTVRPIVTLGETMGLLHSQTVGSLAHAGAMNLSVGGAESNVAIALSRLGVAARWIGRIGDDSLGVRVRRELLAEGIEVRAVVDPVAPTGLMLKERRAAESARVWYYRDHSAGSRLCVDDIDEGDIRSAALLHVTGITAGLSASALEAVLHAVGVAKDAAVPVSFDINHRSTLWKTRDPADTYRLLASQADLVFGGLDEVEMVTGRRAAPEQAAELLARLGPSEVVIKLGADGCLVRANGTTVSHGAVPITVVDSVGAGDAFVGGYLAEHVSGGSIGDKMSLAVQAGAFACLSPGDWEGLPRRGELDLLFATETVTR